MGSGNVWGSQKQGWGVDLAQELLWPPCCASPTWHFVGNPGRRASLPEPAALSNCNTFQHGKTHRRAPEILRGYDNSVYVSAGSDVSSECGVITGINKQQPSWRATNPLVCPELGGLVGFTLLWRCHSFLIGSVRPLLSLFLSCLIRYLECASCKLNSWSTGLKWWRPPW